MLGALLLCLPVVYIRLWREFESEVKSVALFLCLILWSLSCSLEFIFLDSLQSSIETCIQRQRIIKYYNKYGWLSSRYDIYLYFLCVRISTTKCHTHHNEGLTVLKFYVYIVAKFLMVCLFNFVGLVWKNSHYKHTILSLRYIPSSCGQIGLYLKTFLKSFFRRPNKLKLY